MRTLRSRAVAVLVGWMLQSGPHAYANTLSRFYVYWGADIYYLGVELFDQDKPATVGNFVRLIDAGAYTGMFLHRLDPDFVIQGGGWAVGNGIQAIGNFGPITNEYDVGPQLSNLFGTLAMARVGGQTNSATSEFFFNLADNSGLDTVDGGFTVFGRVVAGVRYHYEGGGLYSMTNLPNAQVLTNFNALSYSNGIVNWQAIQGGDPAYSAFTELPVTFTNAWRAPATVEDLFRCDVSLLTVSVAFTNNHSRVLSWDSADGQLNIVEYSTDPGATNWTPLAWGPGEFGQRYSVLDTDTVDQVRFYRVRVQ